MMESDNFWIQWEYHTFLRYFATHPPEKAIVLLQILNLVFIADGPIRFDPRVIGGVCHNMQGAKCRRIIEHLVATGELRRIGDDLISHGFADRLLEKRREKRKKASENGKKGRDIQLRTQAIQRLSQGQARYGVGHIIQSEEDLEISLIDKLPPYDIGFHLTDDDRIHIGRISNGSDVQYLIRTFNEAVSSGKLERPQFPTKAFFGWVKKYTAKYTKCVDGKAAF